MSRFVCRLWNEKEIEIYLSQLNARIDGVVVVNEASLENNVVSHFLLKAKQQLSDSLPNRKRK